MVRPLPTHFAWAVKLNCPLTDSQFVGTCILSYLEGAESPVLGSTVFGDEGAEINVSVVSATKRKLTMTYGASAGIGNGPVDINFELVCTVEVPDNNQKSGLGCTAS